MSANHEPVLVPACPSCGAACACGDAAGALCPRCLLLLGLDTAAGESEPPATSPADSGPVDRWIGGYRILRKLGEGGMGVVYEAEQQSPQRSVAVKVIRGGALLDEQATRLFQREAQALGRLKHPGIAAIYEAGRTAEGQHFFAMELVNGETLTEYLARRRQEGGDKLELRELLVLFLRVCEAVGYAHQRGVIHRDLKPSNILLSGASSSRLATEAAQVPAVKVLDFGLARITDADVQAATLVSELGQIRGTLPYMSPEQVRGNPDEIDLRSDVYSLGVVLYELLSGTLPYEIPKASLPEAVRVIVEQRPRPPSLLAELGSKLDRDLETIVLQCLEKEPGRRYPSVSVLAADIERFLANQPILARPPSTTYQLRKLVARHRLAFGSLAAVIALLAAFGVAMAVQARRLAVERDRALAAEKRATTEAETAKQVTEFLVGLFEVVDPSQSRGNTITAREVLDRGASRIRKELADQPAVRAALLDSVGRVYTSLGLYEPAEPLLVEALASRRRTFGARSAEAAASLDSLVRLRNQADEDATGVPLAQESLALHRELFGANSVQAAASQTRLAQFFVIADPPRAERLLRSSLRILRSYPGHQELLADSLVQLGATLSRRRDHAGAEPLLREALAIRRRLLGEDHPAVLEATEALAADHWLSGAYAEAEAETRDLLSRAERLLGPEHPGMVGDLLHGLAILAFKRGAVEEAQRYDRRALALSRKAGTDAWTVVLLTTLARGEAALGRWRSAEAICHEHLELGRRLPAGQAGAGRALLLLGDIHRQQGALGQAEAAYRDALVDLHEADRRSEVPALASLSLARALFGLAETMRTGDEAERRQLYGEALAVSQRNAQRLRLRQPRTWDRIAEADVVAGASLARLGRFAEAEPVLLRSYPLVHKQYGPADERTAEAARWMRELYVALGRPEKAAEYEIPGERRSR